MATKGAPAGVKRKSVTGTKAKYNGKPDGKAKKARLENPKPSKVGEDDSDDAAESSDSEDGGVKLGERSSHKGGKGSGKPSDGKTFEKGEHGCSSCKRTTADFL
jgi:pumilio family protein 6